MLKPGFEMQLQKSESETGRRVWKWLEDLSAPLCHHILDTSLSMLKGTVSCAVVLWNSRVGIYGTVQPKR